MYQNFIIPYLYETQHVTGDTPAIIRSLKLHCQPLVFHTWKDVRRVVSGPCQAQCAWQGPPTTRPTTFHVWKTRGCQCSFRLLMMGGVSPETCWASYKYRIIKILIHFCILLDFSPRIKSFRQTSVTCNTLHVRPFHSWQSKSATFRLARIIIIEISFIASKWNIRYYQVL
jgi:hypothetical protein